MSVGISHLQIETIVRVLACRVFQVQDDPFLRLEDVLDPDAASRVEIRAIGTAPAPSIGAGDSEE